MGYIFDPDELHEVVRSALGQPIEQMVDQIAADLSERHPGHIVDDREWVFNNAGGAMGSMMVLHASLSEYVLVFGSAIGTEGASGRFLADDWFFMLEGEHWSYREGDFEKTITRAGEVSHLPKGQAKAYRFPESAWGVEYARGAIPLMFPFGFADTFTSTLDFVGFARTMKLYSRAVMRSTATRLRESGVLPARVRQDTGTSPRGPSDPRSRKTNGASRPGNGGGRDEPWSRRFGG
jgi:C-8 sterol isomerase